MRKTRIPAALVDERLVEVPAKRVALVQNHKVPSRCDYILRVLMEVYNREHGFLIRGGVTLTSNKAHTAGPFAHNGYEMA